MPFLDFVVVVALPALVASFVLFGREALVRARHVRADRRKVRELREYARDVYARDVNQH